MTETRLGFVAAGWRTEVGRSPDPDLLARVRPVAGPAADRTVLERAAAERRHTEREE